MSIIATFRQWRDRRKDAVREEAEAKARAQGKLNAEVIAAGEQAEQEPSGPGTLGTWEK
jgi:hypothetical protein